MASDVSLLFHNYHTNTMLFLVVLLRGLAIPLPATALSTVFRDDIIQRALIGRDTEICSNSPDWQDTIIAWEDTSTDSWLQNFHTNLATDGSHAFDQALGSQYGAHYPAFKCGIDLYSTCPLPACSDYENPDYEISAYLATVSTVHLATKFNIIHSAITNGQLGYQGVIDDLADNFFQWKDPVFLGDDIATWLTAVIAVAFSALALGTGVPAEAAIIAGVGTFLGAATQETSNALTPPDGLLRNTGISYLKKTSAQLGESSRNAIEAWSNTTFAGLPDSQGHTIVDYLKGGGFLLDVAVPSASETERYYKTSMIAKTINWQWNTKANFLMFVSTDNRSATYGPANSSYYSVVKNGVYNLYNLESKQVQEPSGLKLLSDSVYGISPRQVTESSARAWEFAGNSYTSAIAASRIQDSFDSNGTLNPFADGAAWEGMFTLPVCDVGNHTEWLTDYGGDGLPCCCGVDCKDTKAFVQAANLNTSAALFKGCQTLLKHMLLNFDGIDYGIELRSAFQEKWEDQWSTGQKAGISVGLILAGLVAIPVVCLWLVFCYRMLRIGVFNCTRPRRAKAHSQF